MAVYKDKAPIEEEQKIIDTILQISGKYNAHQVFSDWIEMCAISIQSACCIYNHKKREKLEEKYKSVVAKYEREEVKKMSEMFGMLVLCFEKDIRDYLGDIYMRSGAGSKQAGQFFTPFNLSVLMATLTMRQVDEEHPLLINEPSVGGGGMILAAAKALKERKINYQRCMKVVTQDIDWNGVYMTYLQLSILGIKAIVVQGDTINEPYHKNYDKNRVLYTPAEIGVIYG